ncbi:MAG: RodZ domain-containing protein [Egibacteraceae bacterium]
MVTGIGDTLRAARRQQGRTLADAAAETRVRELYLAALEEEEFSTLGGDVYVKGFLRSYARYLGVDPDPLLDRFRAEHGRPEDHATATPVPLPPVGHVGPMGPMGERQRPPQAVVIMGIAIGILVVLALIGLSGDEQRIAAPAPAPVEEIDRAQGLSSRAEFAEQPDARSPDPSQGAVSPGDSGVFEPFRDIVVDLAVTSGESYIRSDVGLPEVEGVKQAGFTQRFRGGDTDMVRLRIGDASRVQLMVNGQDLGQLGRRGDVLQVTCEAGETGCEVRKIVPD